MNKTVLTLALLALLATAASAQDTITVVTPHETIASMAEQIGGDAVDAISLSSGTRDPHYVSAKPSFMVKTRRADLWIRFGMDMEIGYERLILEGSRNPDIMVGGPRHLDLSRGVIKLEVPHGPVDRSMGDVHPQGNPHYWLDPYNGRIMARAIALKLGEISPARAEQFRDRGEELVAEIDKAMFGEEAVQAIDADALWIASFRGTVDETLEDAGVSPGGWYAAMAPVKGMAFVSYHKTFAYFANRFGLETPIELEPKPGIPPGPRHVLEVINTIKAQDISLIVQATYYDMSAARNAAEKTGASIVTAPTAVGGSEAATDYIALIDELVRIFSTANNR